MTLRRRILSIKDEYLALKNNAAIALTACNNNDAAWKKIVCKQIHTQLDNGTFNDLLVRKNYTVLQQCIEQNATTNIEYLIIWAEHCAEESKLQWKFSFLLRLMK